MAKRAKGGNVRRAKAGAKVEIAEKCAMIAVDTPNAPAKPKSAKASTINEALKHLGVVYKFKLRRLDGTSTTEKHRIEELDDFEEATIVEKSEVLREMKRQMAFLHDFQHELQNNPTFREELRAFMESDKREHFLQFLCAWRDQLKKPSSQFIELLRS